MANFVGVNVNQLSAVRGCLTTYYNKAVKILDTMNTSIKPDSGIKGSNLESAVTKYVESVKEEGKEWLSQILKYQDLLDKRIAELAANANKANNILNNGSKRVSSQTTAYKYKGSYSSAASNAK